MDDQPRPEHHGGAICRAGTLFRLDRPVSAARCPKAGESGSDDPRSKTAGEDAKKLVGKAEFGTPSAYLIKQEIRGIKQLAYEFAQQTGDPGFLNMVDRALVPRGRPSPKGKPPVKHSSFPVHWRGIYPGASETRNHNAKSAPAYREGVACRIPPKR